MAKKNSNVKKRSNRDSSTDAVSADRATIAPGLGDVSPSNIIAGTRTRHHTPSTTADGLLSEYSLPLMYLPPFVSSFNQTPIHPSSPPPVFIGGIPVLPAFDTTYDEFLLGSSAPASADDRSGEVKKASTGKTESSNHAKRAKVGGKARGNQSAHDDAVDSTAQSGGDEAVENPPPKTHGSGSTTTSGGKARKKKSGNNKNDVEGAMPGMSGGKATRGNQSGEEKAVEKPPPNTHGSGSATTSGGKSRAKKSGTDKNDVESPLAKNRGSGWGTMSGMSGGKAPRGNQSGEEKALENPSGGKGRAKKSGNNKNDVESLADTRPSGCATVSGMSGGKARGKNAVEGDDVPHPTLPEGHATHVAVGARKSPPENL